MQMNDTNKIITHRCEYDVCVRVLYFLCLRNSSIQTTLFQYLYAAIPEQIKVNPKNYPTLSFFQSTNHMFSLSLPLFLSLSLMKKFSVNYLMFCLYPLCFLHFSSQKTFYQYMAKVGDSFFGVTLYYITYY